MVERRVSQQDEGASSRNRVGNEERNIQFRAGELQLLNCPRRIDVMRRFSIEG